MQSKSINFNFGHFGSFLGKYQGYSLTFWPQMVSFSSLVNMQSKSINVKCGHFWLIVGQNTKAIALLFGHNWLIFITFQSAIKLNQFQVWSFLAHFSAKYQGYSLNFSPQMAHFHQLSICNQNQSISSFGQFWLICGQNTKAIALLFLAKTGSFSSTFQSAIKLNQFQVWSFLAHFWAKYQGYSLTFSPQLAHFHHLSICNQNQSISILVSFGSFVGKIPRL